MLISDLIAVFVRAYSLDLLEYARKMCKIGKSYLLGNVLDLQRRVFEELLGLFDPDSVKYLGEIASRVLIYQFAQMPLAHIDLVSNVR